MMAYEGSESAQDNFGKFHRLYDCFLALQPINTTPVKNYVIIGCSPCFIYLFSSK